MKVQSMLSRVFLGIGASVASGVLLFFSLPTGVRPYGDMWMLAWVMFVPILTVTRETRFIVGFLAGIAASVTCDLLARAFFRGINPGTETSWIDTSIAVYGTFFSIFLGIWAEGKLSQKPLYWLASLAVLLETASFLKIPAQVATTQYRNGLMLQVASLGGIFLISFLIWYSNLAIARFPKNIRFVLPGVIACFGYSLIPMHQDTTGSVKVGLVQYDTSDEKGLRKGQASALRSGAQVAVWPEFGGIMFSSRGDLTKLVDLAKETIPIITSYPDGSRPKPFNTANLVTGEGVSEPYHKRKLFGGETVMHQPGDQAVAITAPSLSGKIGLNICYDSCFPNLIRETAAITGTRWIALPTIDPPSPGYFVAANHAAFTPFRAAENGISMVRVDGDFGSMVVEPDGTISSEIREGSHYRLADVNPQRRWTLYQIFGDLWLYVMIGAFAHGLLEPLRKAFKRINTDENDRLKEFVEKDS